MNLRTVIPFALFLAAATAAAAPPPHGPDMDKVALLLDLDDYQRQQVEAAFVAQREAQRAKFEASEERPDFEALRAAREEILGELKTSLADVLSPLQLEKLEALMTLMPHRERMRRFHEREDAETGASEGETTE